LNRPDDNSYWNHLEKRPPVLKFLLLVLLCAMLAYLLSSAAG